MTSYRHIDSPLGTILLRAQGAHLTGLFFAGQKYHPAGIADSRDAPPADAAVLDRAASELAEYFAGRRDTFTVPVRFAGSPFQQRVWQALREIAAGESASYAEIAARIGAPGSARAVAQACAANPLAVAIPCHRVVRNDGSISGYRWGVERKRALLEREAAAA